MMNRFVILLAAGVSALTLGAAAQAADLIIDAPVAGVVDASSGWEGAFIGVFGGAASGELTGDFAGTSVSGALLGVDAGVNFDLADGVVAGLVADIAWSNQVDEFDAMFLQWSGSLRGRIGIDGGAFMPYLTAGLAVGQGYAEPPDVGNLHVGWTAGAGVEIAATDELSIDLQYRYTNLGAKNYAGPDVGFSTHQVTAGLHWNF